MSGLNECAYRIYPALRAQNKRGVERCGKGEKVVVKRDKNSFRVYKTNAVVILWILGNNGKHIVDTLSYGGIFEVNSW